MNEYKDIDELKEQGNYPLLSSKASKVYNGIIQKYRGVGTWQACENASFYLYQAKLTNTLVLVLPYWDYLLLSYHIPSIEGGGGLK